MTLCSVSSKAFAELGREAMLMGLLEKHGLPLGLCRRAVNLFGQG